VLEIEFSLITITESEEVSLFVSLKSQCFSILSTWKKQNQLTLYFNYIFGFLYFPPFFFFNSLMTVLGMSFL
jgi:hypothetical protein